MTIAINIRGTGGSGKSTLVKKVMELYHNRAHITIPGRKRPYFTALWHDGGGPGLIVPGHYETACGGCDTIKTVDEVYKIVRTATLGSDPTVERSHHALSEGIMGMDDVTRAVQLHQDLEKEGGKLVVISLTTPVDECLRRIRQRRAEGGNEKPLNEKNTRDRAARQEKILHRLKQAGVPPEKLSCEDAYARIRQLLEV